MKEPCGYRRRSGPPAPAIARRSTNATRATEGLARRKDTASRQRSIEQTRRAPEYAGAARTYLGLVLERRAHPLDIGVRAGSGSIRWCWWSIHGDGGSGSQPGKIRGDERRGKSGESIRITMQTAKISFFFRTNQKRAFVRQKFERDFRAKETKGTGSRRCFHGRGGIQRLVYYPQALSSNGPTKGSSVADTQPSTTSGAA